MFHREIIVKIEKQNQAVLMRLYNIIMALTVSAFLLSIASCRTMAIRGVSSVSVKEAGGINLSENDFVNMFDKSYFDESGYSMVVVPFSYSPFIEVTAFSGSEMATVKKQGEMKVLVRIMDGEKVLKVFFVEVEEEGKENLLRAFREKVKEQIPGRY